MSVEQQIQMENLLHKNKLMRRLRSEFLIPDVVDHIQEHNLPLDFTINLMAQMVLLKRANVGVLIGALHHHFLIEGDDEEGDPVTVREAMEKAAEFIKQAAIADLVDRDPVSGKIVLKWELDVSQDVYDDLDRFQYPLPMLVPPREIQTNKDTGYLTMKGSVVLKNHDYEHDDDLCLDHLNRVNRVAYTMNPQVAQMVENTWKDLDKKKDDETDEEFEDRQRAFRKFDEKARDCMEAMFMQGNEFFFTHKYDKRGRCYSQGHHLNVQGNAWQKAVLEFADKEMVDDR